MPERLAAALLALDAKRYEERRAISRPPCGPSPIRKAEILLTWGVGLLAAEQNAAASKVFRHGRTRRPCPRTTQLRVYLAGGSEWKASPTRRWRSPARRWPRKTIRPASSRGLDTYHAGRYDEARKTYRETVDRFDTDRGRRPRGAPRVAAGRVEPGASRPASSARAKSGSAGVRRVPRRRLGAERPGLSLGRLRQTPRDRAVAMVQKAVNAEPDVSPTATAWARASTAWAASPRRSRSWRRPWPRSPTPPCWNTWATPTAGPPTGQGQGRLAAGGRGLSQGQAAAGRQGPGGGEEVQRT